MTLEKVLCDFYQKNGIPIDGEINNNTFEFKVFRILLNLPNPKFRREVLHIHDIQQF